MLSYKDSGVDVELGNALVSDLKDLVKQTFNRHVIGGIGSFSGAFELPSGTKNPVLLSATDGVGTKLRLAIDYDELEGVGIDLVAMCVNDLICNFGTPLFFLDYYATGKLDKEKALRVIRGIVIGCKEAECALIGGESAEMPGMYAKDDFDLAGFAVGIAEREELDFTKKIQAGDILIGVPSSGLHSNGFSLVRKIIKEQNISLEEKYFYNESLLKSILRPTIIYVPLFKRIKQHIKALAHITGGGIVENLPRVLPDNLCACVNLADMPKLEIFSLFEKYLESKELYRTFNMGVGLVLVVSPQEVDYVLSQATNSKVIGEIITRKESQICLR